MKKLLLITTIAALSFSASSAFAHNHNHKHDMIDTPVTVEHVREILEKHIAMRDNPNIKVGEVTEVDGKIKATIVTQEDSLVKEIEIDPDNPRAGLSKIMGKKGGKRKHHMKKDNRDAQTEEK